MSASKDIEVRHDNGYETTRFTNAYAEIQDGHLKVVEKVWFINTTKPECSCFIHRTVAGYAPGAWQFWVEVD